MSKRPLTNKSKRPRKSLAKRPPTLQSKSKRAVQSKRRLSSSKQHWQTPVLTHLYFCRIGWRTDRAVEFNTLTRLRSIYEGWSEAKNELQDTLVDLADFQDNPFFVAHPSTAPELFPSTEYERQLCDAYRDVINHDYLLHLFKSCTLKSEPRRLAMREAFSKKVRVNWLRWLAVREAIR